MCNQIFNLNLIFNLHKFYPTLYFRKKLLEKREFTYLTIWFKERPSTIFKKIFRIIVDSFHNLCPIQTLNSFRIFDITRTKITENYKNIYVTYFIYLAKTLYKFKILFSHTIIFKVTTFALLSMLFTFFMLLISV